MTVRVIHLIDSGGLYGAEKVLLTLVREQVRDRRTEPLIVSVGEPGEPEKPLERAAREANLPLKTVRMRPGLNLRDFGAVLHEVQKGERPCVLHSHGYKFNILLAAMKLRRLPVPPVVTTVHGYVQAPRFTKMWVYEKLDRLALRMMDAVVCVSRYQRDHHLPAGVARRAQVIYNGLPPSDFPIKPRPPIPAPSEARPLRLLGVGRLSYEKGFDLLIATLSELREHGVPATLTLAGEGPEAEHLRAQARALRLENAVTFAGYVDDVPALFETHDLLVMPSRTEGLPVTLLEALRAGMPALATAVGGIPEVAEKTHFVAVEPSASGLVEGLGLYLRQYSQRHFMGLPKELTSAKMHTDYCVLVETVLQMALGETCATAD